MSTVYPSGLPVVSSVYITEEYGDVAEGEFLVGASVYEWCGWIEGGRWKVTGMNFPDATMHDHVEREIYNTLHSICPPSGTGWEYAPTGTYPYTGGWPHKAKDKEVGND
jgi:hypothetical protein